MKRWWAAAACLLIGCGQQAGRSGSGIVSGVDQEPAPDGGPTDGGTVACVPGGGANLVASAGSGQPVCGQIFPGVPPGTPDVRIWPRLAGESCRAASINGRNDVVQANDIEQSTDLYARRADPPPDDSLYNVGRLLKVHGPLADGFFLELQQPDERVFMFGWHILNGPTRGQGFLYPRLPAAGARDLQAGAAIVGAPGRGFPCDPDPAGDGTPPDCTGLTDGIYLREFGSDAAPRFTGLLVFDPLGPGGQVAVGVSVNGWTLVLAIRADGSTLGRWVNPGGEAGEPVLFTSLPAGAVTDAVLAPLARGGLAFRRNGEWVRVFDPLAGDSPPPCWLTGLAGFDLRITANGNGYAAIPTDAVDRHCDRAMDLYTVEGLPCGSVPLGTADESCTGHVTLGPQGSVLRLLEGPTFEAGHPSCELHTWPDLLGPSP
jgi:hypothetical protein